MIIGHLVLLVLRLLRYGVWWTASYSLWKIVEMMHQLGNETIKRGAKHVHQIQSEYLVKSTNLSIVTIPHVQRKDRSEARALAELVPGGLHPSPRAIGQDFNSRQRNKGWIGRVDASWGGVVWPHSPLYQYAGHSYPP